MKDIENLRHTILLNLLESFVRIFPIEFDEDDFVKFASITGVSCKKDEVTRFLQDSTVVFKMPAGKYLSRGKLFENRYFSIKPDKFEVENGILIIGDRCIPFMDPSMIPEGFIFFRGKKALNRKIMEIPTGIVLDHYALYGEEYAIQYINMDSCNRDINLTGMEYSLPPTLKLSVLDVSELMKKSKFKHGDRFLLQVKSFLEGHLSIEPISDHRLNPFRSTPSEEAREFWNKHMELCLAQSFDSFGPCRSIDEQLAYAVWLDSEALTSKACGSISEMLKKSELIKVTEFGVESRLWYSDRPISIVPPLSEDADSDVERKGRSKISSEIAEVPVTDVVLRVFVRDSLWMHENDDSNIYSRLIKNEEMIESKQAEFLKLRLKKHYSIISQNYNRFADANIGSVRHTALILYAQLLEFVCYLSQSGVPDDALPQQDLVIFSQIWSHVSKMVEEFENQLDLDSKDCSNASKSIEGMSYSVADVSPRLRKAVEEYKKQEFSII